MSIKKLADVERDEVIRQKSITTTQHTDAWDLPKDLTCKGGHKLTPTTSVRAAGNLCDECKMPLAGKVGLSCTPCQYDICKDCAHEKHTQGKAAEREKNIKNMLYKGSSPELPQVTATTTGGPASGDGVKHTDVKIEVHHDDDELMDLKDIIKKP